MKPCLAGNGPCPYGGCGPERCRNAPVDVVRYVGELETARTEALRSEPTAWAIFAADTHEMIDFCLIEPDEAPGLYSEPLFMRSPLRQSGACPHGSTSVVCKYCDAETIEREEKA